MRTPLLRISPGSCLLVAVGLIAHPAAAAPTATPNTVTFCLNPNVSISSQLSQQTISVTDGSGNALIVSSATLTPAVDTRVLRADTLPVTGRVDLVVPSMPAAGTAYTGYLAINTSAGGVWVQVALSVSSSCSGGYGTGVVSAIPASLPISVPSGSTISSQYQVSLYSTVTTAATISAQTANSGNWLSVITPTGTSVVNLTAGGTTTLIVYGIATSLANGQYSGSISVLIGGAVVQTVAVVMTVGSSGSSTVMLAPSPLSFTYTPGGTLPPAQNMILTIPETASASYTATATTTAGGSWLLINNTTAVSGTIPLGQVSAPLFSISVNPGGLSQGIYYGAISATTSVGSTSATVTLTVGTGGTGYGLTFTPSAINFSSSGTMSQSVTISSSTAGLTYTAAPNVSWLSLYPTTGYVNATQMLVAANVTGLSAGYYSGLITVTTGSGNPSGTLVVNLTVGAYGTGGAGVAPGSLTFSYQSQSTTTPTAQQLLLMGTPGAAYTVTPVSTGSWLGVGNGAGTLSLNGTATVLVSVSPGTMTAGTYSGSLNVICGTQITVVGVTLNVTASAVMAVGVYGDVVMTFPGGATQPQYQTLYLSSSGSAALTFWVTASNPWIQVSSSSGTTPAILSVTVSPAALAAGLNNSSITVISNGANSPLVIPVVASNGGGPLTLTPASLSFTAAAGSAAQSQTVAVTSTGTTAFTASVTAGANWLSVSPTSAYTNATLTITATPDSLAPGNYSGTVALTANGQTQNIGVTLAVGAGATLSTLVSSVALQYDVPSATVTGTQGFGVTSTSSVAFTAAAATSSGGNWLSVSPTSGTAPGWVSITVNGANLQPGNYTGTITLTPSGGTAVSVTVNLTVTGPPPTPVIVMSQSSLSFTYNEGGAMPVAQSVNLTSSGTALQFSALASSSGWLSVSPASGTTPAALSISVDVSSLGAGNYTGTITLSAGSSGSTSITVNLAVTAPLPTVSSVVNAASYGTGAIAPGEIVTIFGADVGPGKPAALAMDASGRVATATGNTQVLFNGIPAPMIYASGKLLSAVVPYEVAGRTSTAVQVKYRGVGSNIMTVPVTTTAPGIFTLDASGTGLAAALNEDGSVNGPGTPAAKGSVIVLYATGEGQTLPGGVNGQVISPYGLTRPVLPAAALVDGQPADIVYIGGAPGMVAGVMQINVRVPPGVSSGNVPVLLTIGRNNSQVGVTVAVR